VAAPSPFNIGDGEKAGIAEAERLVKEAEFGARDLTGWSFWLSGAVALATTCFPWPPCSTS
jgi:hypothetical protein